MFTIGIFADGPSFSTGMAIVNSNLAYNLNRIYNNIRVIYFARFGQEKGVSEQSEVYEGYELVPTEGGVWKSDTVEEAIRKYHVSLVYSEDDWWSMLGLIKATKRTKTPFYFMTPVDSLPIQREGKNLLEKYCNLVFVPNASYRYLKNGVELRHAVDTQKFKPVRQKAFNKFTFLWVGRDERRKALGRAILAFEKIYKDYECNFVVRSSWGATPMAAGTDRYIKNKKLPIMQDKISNCSHEYLANVYSSCHAYLCTSKAGGSEMGILEAAACGLPSIATDWTFMCENVLNGKTGFLVPPESYDVRPKKTVYGKEMRGTRGAVWGNISINGLAEKMVWMIEHQEEAKQMGMNGFERVRKYYDWKNVATRFYDLIEEDLEKRKLYKIG